MTTMTAEDFLEHYGVKGQQWGVRRDRKQDKQTTKDMGSKAREIIREARIAETPAARKAAADRYKKEVLKPIQTDEFKAAYNNANSVTKGQMAAHVLLFGVFSPITIKAAKNASRAGYDLEVDTAHEIFKELRRP